MSGDDDIRETEAELDARERVFTGSAAPVTVYTTDEVATIDERATLRDVSRRLVAGEVGALLVGTPDDVVGLVSERDVVRALAHDLDPDECTAGDVASRELLWCSTDATVGEVSDLMMEHYVRHVLVGEPGALAGILSARDLLGAYAPPPPD